MLVVVYILNTTPESSKMFYDLNIKRLDSSPVEMKALVNEAYSRGYDVIAITTDWTEESPLEIGNKRKRKAASNPPAPYDVQTLKEIPIKVYNRINILIKESSSFHRINKMRDLKGYDIISYVPGNAAVLKSLPGVPDFDILTFDPAVETQPLHFNRKLYNQFVQNGVFMEVPYAPCISDSTYRKYTISTAHIYHAIGKSENIIVSSSANSWQYLRSPYDIINLGALFGLSEKQSKNSISRNCENMLLKARTRRRGKSTMEVITIN